MKLITRIEAADFLRISPRTLEKWAVTGQGPPFFKIGSRTAYSLDDLVTWLLERQRTSTTEARGAER